MSLALQRHILRASLDTSYGEADVVLRIVCESPVGALCRKSCSKGCEEYEPDHEHELVDTDECNAELFINEGGVHVSYSPVDSSKTFALHDGAAVTVSWEGDYYSWRLAEDAPAVTS